MSITHDKSQVAGSGPAAAVLQNNAAIITVAEYFIPAFSYHFIVAMLRARRATFAQL
jgi:hypothetical protein